MIHRTDLAVHIRRNLVESYHLSHILDPNMPDWHRAKLLRMSYHHDDPEIGTGDIPAPVKAAMTAEEKAELKAREKAWIQRVATFFIDPYHKDLYLAEQKEIHEKLTPDAQFVNIVDKLDALGETMHELYSGNRAFLGPLQYYRELFASFEGEEIWEQMKNDPAIGLGEFPSDDYFPEEAIWTPERAKNIDSLWNVSRIEEDIHPWYRSYLGIINQQFFSGTAKFLFPGWPETWQRTDEPHVRTSLDGVILR